MSGHHLKILCEKLVLTISRKNSATRFYVMHTVSGQVLSVEKFTIKTETTARKPWYSAFRICEERICRGKEPYLSTFKNVKVVQIAIFQGLKNEIIQLSACSRPVSTCQWAPNQAQVLHIYICQTPGTKFVTQTCSHWAKNKLHKKAKEIA